MPIDRIFIFAFAVSLALATSACPGSLDDPERFKTSTGACDAVKDVFAPRCATAGCHSAADKQENLDLETAGIAGRTVGKPSKGNAALNLVDPGGDPAKSVLYTKLTTTPPFGSRMPQVGAKLDDASIACVKAWVAAQGTGKPDTGGSDAPAGDSAGGADVADGASD